jgi:hypothetical protein
MTELANSVYELNAGLICTTVASASNICSLLTLYLIWKSKRWNAYVQIILSMTVSQLLYDISFYFLLNGSDLAFYFQEFLSSYAGAATALWTNVVSGVVMYLVVTRKSMDIEKQYCYFFSFISTISLLLAVTGCVYLNSDVRKRDICYDAYIAFRGVSILFNIVSYFVISRNLNEIGISSRYSSIRAPLQLLSSRIKYYPIVQILSRAWPTYYEIAYGFSKLHNKVYAVNNMQEIVSLYLFAFFLPIAGIGYFIVFLSMQPLAWHNFKVLLGLAKPLKQSQRRGLSYTVLGQTDLSDHQFALLEDEIANGESLDHQSNNTPGYSTADDRSAHAEQFEARSTMSNHHLITTASRQHYRSSYDDMDERELFRQLRALTSSDDSTSSTGQIVQTKFMNVDTTSGNPSVGSTHDSSLKGSRGKSTTSSQRANSSRV